MSVSLPSLLSSVCNGHAVCWWGEHLTVYPAGNNSDCCYRVSSVPQLSFALCNRWPGRELFSGGKKWLYVPPSDTCMLLQGSKSSDPCLSAKSWLVARQCQCHASSSYKVSDSVRINRAWFSPRRRRAFLRAIARLVNPESITVRPHLIWLGTSLSILAQ